MTTPREEIATVAGLQGDSVAVAEAQKGDVMEPKWWSDVRQALADGGKPELINKLWSEFQEAQTAGARKMAERIAELIDGQRNGIEGDEAPEMAARLGLAVAHACVRQAVKERKGDG